MMLLVKVLLASIVDYRMKKAQRCAHRLRGLHCFHNLRLPCPLPVIDKLKAIILIVDCCGSTDDRNEMRSKMSLKDYVIDRDPY